MTSADDVAQRLRANAAATTRAEYADLEAVVEAAERRVGADADDPLSPPCFRRILALASSTGTLYSSKLSRSALTSALSTPRSEASSSAWSSRFIRCYLLGHHYNRPVRLLLPAGDAV